MFNVKLNASLVGAALLVGCWQSQATAQITVNVPNCPNSPITNPNSIGRIVLGIDNPTTSVIENTPRNCSFGGVPFSITGILTVAESNYDRSGSGFVLGDGGSNLALVYRLSNFTLRNTSTTTSLFFPVSSTPFVGWTVEQGGIDGLTTSYTDFDGDLLTSSSSATSNFVVSFGSSFTGINPVTEASEIINNPQISVNESTGGLDSQNRFNPPAVLTTLSTVLIPGTTERVPPTITQTSAGLFTLRLAPGETIRVLNSIDSLTATERLSKRESQELISLVLADFEANNPPQPVSTPEPATMAGLAVAAGVLGLSRKRQPCQPKA